MDLSRTLETASGHQCVSPVVCDAPFVSMRTEASTIPVGFWLHRELRIAIGEDGLHFSRPQPPAILGIRCTSLSGPMGENSASW